MFNGFINKKKEEELAKVKRAEFRKKTLTKTKNTQSQASIQRSKIWSANNYNNDVAQILLYGANPYKHESLHEFRDYPQKGNIYLRTYIPEKQRVILSINEYFSRNYIKEPYNPKDPNVMNGLWLRKKAKDKHISKDMK